jgi:hypothetical protein
LASIGHYAHETQNLFPAPSFNSPQERHPATSQTPVSKAVSRGGNIKKSKVLSK